MSRSRAGVAETVQILAIAAVYAVTARLGLLLDPVGGFATLVWAPTGIALAATLRLGYRVWPGLFLGAFVANLLTGAPPIVAAAIGIGNTLEAVLGVYALRRLPGFRSSLERLRDILAFMAIGAALAPVVSATIGVASLAVARVLPASELIAAWRAWWVGDFIGALLVGPLILAWTSQPFHRPSRSRALEMLAMAITVVAVASIVFFSHTPLERGFFVQAYVMLPGLIWAAVRFEQRGATTAVFLASVVAILGTTQGSGPFLRRELHESLFALQTFMGILAVSFLVLATAIAERTRAQEAMRHALAAAAHANQAKSDFLAVMSHELRTPLNAISGYAQLLSIGVHGPLSENQRDAVARIQANQSHLASLVEDILGFTRIEAGRLALTAERIVVADAVSAVEPLVQLELQRRQIGLERLPVDEGIAVTADAAKLRQILLNFLSNAIKHTEDGGRIEIGATKEGLKVRIFVRDDGAGIPSDQIERVFEPFFQVERGTTRRYPGVGLGLTIARDLARAMRGDVTISSTAGQGTTAAVVLPVA
jgi:signal transduction histidine kinase